MAELTLESLTEEQRIELEKHYERELDGHLDGIISTIADAVVKQDSLCLYFIGRCVTRLLTHANREIEKAKASEEFVWTATRGSQN